MVLYVITNDGSTAAIVPTDGTTVPIIQNPDNAQNINYQLAQSSSPLIQADEGFALLPGSEYQYGIIATYSIPYKNKITLAQPFVLPVSSATIIVPEGVKVRSDQLKDAGQQTFSDTVYHIFQGENLAASSSLTAVISGNPGDKGIFPLSQRNLLMVGVGSLGLVLVGLGVFLFIRERKLSKQDDLEEEVNSSEEGDALGEDRLGIMDAIIALDDQFKAGGINREAYNQRRDELKERLKKLVD
jgi:hypothetical protein